MKPLPPLFLCEFGFALSAFGLPWAFRLGTFGLVSGAVLKLILLLLGAGLAVPAAHASVHYQRLKSLGSPDLLVNVRAPVIQASDGALYGMTTGISPNSTSATVFRLNKDGSGYSVLHSFGNTGGDGQSPRAGLTRGTDGTFYGTTRFGGDWGSGTVFRIWRPQTPDLIGMTMVANTVQVRFAGVSAYQYQVLRSITSAPDNTNTYYLATGHLAPYLKSLAVWKCPADKSTSKHGGVTYPRVRSCSMNALISGLPQNYDYGDSPFVVFRKLSDLDRGSPCDIFVMLDEREDSINDGGFFTDQWNRDSPSAWQFIDWPASYHNCAGAFNFV